MFGIKKTQADLLTVARLQIKKHEGLSLKPYRCTAGVLTIGYGRNLNNGISQKVADIMLDEDMEIALRDAKDFAAEAWDKLNMARQAVLVNMAFNLGKDRLFKFIMFRGAVRSHNYEYAAKRMESSLWYKQVGNRGKELVEQMKTGEIR
jgi:lysozyme